MRDMDREQVLGVIYENMIVWPWRDSLVVVNGSEYRGTGWKWASEGRDAYLCAYRQEPITAQDFTSYRGARRTQQGDPNAHESVRTESEEDAPVWSGEGLPPVGAVVSVVVALEGGEAYDAAIIGYSFDEAQAAVEYVLDSSLEFVDVESLRPIRSDEDRAVEEMMEDLVNITSLAQDAGVSSNGTHFVARELYRRGYRKEGA